MRPALFFSLVFLTACGSTAELSRTEEADAGVAVADATIEDASVAADAADAAIEDATIEDAAVEDAAVEDAAPICHDPIPPRVDRLRVIVYNDQGNKKVLDSTALIDDRDYCNAAGFSDRGRCPLRPDGAPDLLECYAIAVGFAEDTGRVGPTWTFNDQPCADAQEDGRCVNHPNNQFLVFVYGSGHARACTEFGVCGEVDVP